MLKFLLSIAIVFAINDVHACCCCSGDQSGKGCGQCPPGPEGCTSDNCSGTCVKSSSCPSSSMLQLMKAEEKKIKKVRKLPSEKASTSGTVEVKSDGKVGK